MDNTMKDIGKRIELARINAGMSLEQLAKRIGISRQAVSLWTKGTTPRIDKLADIAKVLNVSVEYLLHGDQSNIDHLPIRAKVPLIDWELDMQKNNIQDWLLCPVDHSDKTIALRIVGESMYNPHGKPSFSNNDIIFVDCEIKPINGSLVVVKLPNQKEGILRQLIIEGSNQFLKALNPSWPDQIIKMSQDIQIFGVAILKAESLI